MTQPGRRNGPRAGAQSGGGAAPTAAAAAAAAAAAEVGKLAPEFVIKYHE